MKTNTAADAARETYRQSGGRFGNQPRQENTSIVLTGVQEDSQERTWALQSLGIGSDAGSAWEREAARDADTEALAAAAAIRPSKAVSRYQAIAAAVGRQERFDAAIAAGLRSKELIEAEEYEPAVLAGIYDALPPSMKDRTLPVAANGHDRKTLSAYGLPLAQKFALKDLKASTSKPSVLKAMFTATGAALPVLEAMDKAGFRKVQDVLDMKTAIQSDDPAELIRARETVDPQTAAAYWKATGHRRGLNAGELADAARQAG